MSSIPVPPIEDFEDVFITNYRENVITTVHWANSFIRMYRERIAAMQAIPDRLLPHKAESIGWEQENLDEAMRIRARLVAQQTEGTEQKQ